MKKSIVLLATIVSLAFSLPVCAQAAQTPESASGRSLTIDPIAQHAYLKAY